MLSTFLLKRQQRQHISTLFPYTTLFRSNTAMGSRLLKQWIERPLIHETAIQERLNIVSALYEHFIEREHLREALKRSEEHTSELQSRGHLVCRLLLEKKKTKELKYTHTT